MPSASGLRAVTCTALALLLPACGERGQPPLWRNATAQTIGTTAEYTNRVELADLDGDGRLDILFANGGSYESPAREGPSASRVFLNRGAGRRFEESTSILQGLKGYTRVIKVRDLNADGLPDIVLGTTYATQSQLLLGTGGGAFRLATPDLPQLALSVGDLEIGDVDADGDLDMALVDWGPGSPMKNAGGRVHLWLNDGAGRFSDVTAESMPGTRVRFSWDLELVDVDNDWDLDLAISSKLSPTSFLFENDGSGRFSDVTGARLPHYTNNYEFEPMDLDGDGWLDLVTVNDGKDTSGRGGREHVFRNRGDGSFEDVSADWWPDDANPSEDDNAERFLDFDSDGDADFLLFSLSGNDRLLVNDGTGHLSLRDHAIAAPPSRGSLGAALGDLDGDGRLDIVESQGEVPGSFDERVYLATPALPPDTAAPRIRTDLPASPVGRLSVHARVTDGASPGVTGHPESVYAIRDGADARIPLAWYGEYLFRAALDVPAGATGVRICARDGAGNVTCAGLTASERGSEARAR